MLSIALILAVVWGVVWALFLQYVPIGKFLAARRTWLTVVIGVGVDLAIAALIVPWPYLQPVLLIIAFSSIGIIIRSTANEWTEIQELLDDFKNQAR